MISLIKKKGINPNTKGTLYFRLVRTEFEVGAHQLNDCREALSGSGR